MIIIVDFGSQTAHLIARRVRDLGVEVQLVDPDVILEAVAEHSPAGIIFSGGPASVYSEGAPSIDERVFELGLPLLGICYGWQLTAHTLGGKVEQGYREYGPTQLRLADGMRLDSKNSKDSGLASLQGSLFAGIAQHSKVWMSHGDEVVQLPQGFVQLGSTDNVPAALVVHPKKRIFGMQFHPEIQHTEQGIQLLSNFIEHICGCTITPRILLVEEVIASVRKQLEQYPDSMRAIAAVSGGVDSTVASAIVAKAMGKRFVPVYCDNGLMRAGTTQRVQFIFSDLLGIEPVILDCKQEFLRALAGVTDPEQKRTIIGGLYVEYFQKEAKKVANAGLLVQGTIYSDVIESQGSARSSKIKSHHNVGGLPKDMKLKLLEPLREFYKDEVIELGRQLGLPEEIIHAQPFPGPGQAIRILGEVTEQKLAQQQQADAIVLEVLREAGWYDRVFQSFSVLTDAQSSAVMGDGRARGPVVALRCYDSADIMSAGVTQLPYEVLQRISSRIVSEVAGISRVVYDITTKPPATMEWE